MVHFKISESATSGVALEEARKDVGVREFRDHLSKWLDEVKGGRDITITERGRPIARVIPIGWTDHIARLVAEGVVTPAPNPRPDPSTWNPVKLGDGISLSDIVIEERR
jgi:prevent-host-death family protein